MHFTTLYDTLHYVSLLSDQTPIPTVQTPWNKIHRSTQSSVQYLNWILQIFARSEPVQMTKSYFPSSFWVLVGEELKEGWRWCIPRRVWISKRGTGYKCISAAHTYLSSAGSVSERYQAWLCISRSCISAPSTAIAPGRDQTTQPLGPSWAGVLWQCDGEEVKEEASGLGWRGSQKADNIEQALLARAVISVLEFAPWKLHCALRSTILCIVYSGHTQIPQGTIHTIYTYTAL